MEASIIEERKSEINDLCNEATSKIEELKRAKGLSVDAREDRIAYIKTRITRARLALKEIRVELREMGKVQARPHTEKATQLEERIKQIETDLDWAAKSDPNAAIVEQAKATDYREVLKEGAAIQNNDIDRLQRMKATLDTTNQTATNTLAAMDEQKEQIRRVDKGVDDVSTNIQLANRQLKVLVRRIATDKIIMGLMLLCFLGVIVIIIYTAVTKNKAGLNVPST